MNEKCMIWSKIHGCIMYTCVLDNIVNTPLKLSPGLYYDECFKRYQIFAVKTFKKRLFCAKNKWWPLISIHRRSDAVLSSSNVVGKGSLLCSQRSDYQTALVLPRCEKTLNNRWNSLSSVNTRASHKTKHCHEFFNKLDLALFSVYSCLNVFLCQEKSCSFPALQCRV